MTIFLKLDDKAIIPKYATEGSSGFDLCSLGEHFIEPGRTVLVKTGLAVLIPENTELQVRPKSGLSLKTGLRIANSPGTVDEDYLHHDVGIICDNVGNMPLIIHAGDQVAQGVICPVLRPPIIQVNEEEYLTLIAHRMTLRNGGFGSTGDNSDS